MYQSSKTLKTVGVGLPIITGLPRLYQQCTNRQKQSKDSQTAKITFGVPIVTCLHSTQSPPNTQSRANAATSRDLHHMCLGSGHNPSPVSRAMCRTSMRLAPVRCRVLLHSLLPTDDACSSSSLSATFIKFFIFSDPTRKLSALPLELRRIR